MNDLKRNVCIGQNFRVPDLTICPTKKGFQPINILYLVGSKTGIIKAFDWPVSYPQRFIGLKPDKNVQKTPKNFRVLGVGSLVILSWHLSP